tara:strand:- start:3189 stop:3986 length:798 start_codon:yes stop_codon:yes gene_type:complete
MKIVILTGSEIRHDYFRCKIADDKRINVIASFCEGKEKSLENRVIKNKNSSFLEIQHVLARTQSEKDFFSDFLLKTQDKSFPKFIAKGDINNEFIVSEIINLKPELIVCYGASLIKSNLLNKFKGYFINVHLGLSPYYRGSGTNIWALINNEPEMVGATFMHIDSGIDTGEIIHQIRANFFIGDSPHSIGNRLIKKMTDCYANLISNFNFLEPVTQPSVKGKLFLRKDFDTYACRKLYDNFNNGMIENYLKSKKKIENLVCNSGL